MTLFLYTASLSQDTLAAPYNGAPNILNFYLRASTVVVQRQAKVVGMRAHGNYKKGRARE